MPKRSNNSSSGKGVLAILMLTVFGAGGLAAYVRLNPAAAHVQVAGSTVTSGYFGQFEARFRH